MKKINEKDKLILSPYFSRENKCSKIVQVKEIIDKKVVLVDKHKKVVTNSYKEVVKNTRKVFSFEKFPDFFIKYLKARKTRLWVLFFINFIAYLVIALLFFKQFLFFVIFYYILIFILIVRIDSKLLYKEKWKWIN